MKAQSMAVTVFWLFTVHANAGEPQAPAPVKDRTSYAIGADLGRNLARTGIQIDADSLLKGMRDGLSGSTLALTDEEIRAALTALSNEMKKRRFGERKEAAPEAGKTVLGGEAFLAENGKKEGVVTLPSGLQYKILKKGDGPTPTDADGIECQYRGISMDGQEFDSSYRSGKPAVLKVAELIPGWREAAKMMPVGSRWQLFIPWRLGYGDRGAGRIGPGAALIFEVEVLGIRRADQPAAAGKERKEDKGSDRNSKPGE